MPDAQTTASALSEAIRFKVNKNVLANLRADLIFASPEYAEQGDFDPGTDQILYTNVPDLPFSTTPLTEGVQPDKRALSMGSVSVDTEQYGDLVSITDVAKIKDPIGIVPIASERLTRQSMQVLDQVHRDVIAGGGTQFLASTDHTTRATLDSSDVLTVDFLRKLEKTMFKASIPRFPDGFFRLFASAEVANDLGGDADFIDAYKYVDNTPLLTNEVGKIAGFRIMQVVNAPTFSSGITVHASIALGNVKGWGAGELDSLQTYHQAPGGDHSDVLAQEELAGWKVMFGVAVLSNSYYFRVESAGTAL